MSAISDFINRVKGAPSESEIKAKALIKGLGVDDDVLAALMESKNDQALKDIVDGAIHTEVTKATAEASVRLVKVSDALKAAGFDGDLSKADTLKASIEAKIKEAASREALTITASRGIKPVPTTAAAAAGSTESLTAKAVAWRKAQNLPTDN